MGSSFLFPAQLDFWNFGSGGGEKPQRGKSLPPDSDPLTTPSFDKNRVNCQRNSLEAQITDSSFHEHGQLFVGIHELLFLVAMLVSDRDLEKLPLLPTESFLSDPSDGLVENDF
jgi:hypothetical protein